MVAHSDLTSRKRLYNIVPGTQPPRRATRWRHHKGEDREDDQAFDKEDAGLAELRGHIAFNTLYGGN